MGVCCVKTETAGEMICNRETLRCQDETENQTLRARRYVSYKKMVIILEKSLKYARFGNIVAQPVCVIGPISRRLSSSSCVR